MTSRAAIPGRRFAAVVGCLSFLLIGASSLVVPALATDVERSFGQDDAGLGFFFLAGSVAYAIGSVGGGMLTERIGRRVILVTAAALHGAGLLWQAATGSWLLFLLAGVPRGIGAGALDGGVNGLILDLFPEARGRALNAAHLFFALGALLMPLAIGTLTQVGVAWQAIVAAIGITSIPIAIGLALGDMRDGRRQGAAVVVGTDLAPDVPQPHGAVAASAGPSGTLALMSLPVLLLAASIGFYVASEMGVSNWLVRFLSSAPIFVADAALGLFWGGLTVGRLVSAAWADRFDHLTLGIVASVASAVLLGAAVLVPSLPISIALFAAVGFTFGPIYPLIMAIAGERFPDRTAAVSGVLATAGVLGTIIYPPLMGAMSVTVGLSVAMLGTAAIALAGALTLIALRPLQAARRREVPAPLAAAPGEQG